MGIAIRALACAYLSCPFCTRPLPSLRYLLRALVASQAAGATNPKGSASYESNLLGRKEKPAGSELDPQLVELIQVLLTDLVSLPGGVKLLLDELHAASNNHAALTFLAQTVKDQGGVNAAIQVSFSCSHLLIALPTPFLAPSFPSTPSYLESLYLDLQPGPAVLIGGKSKFD